MSDIQHNRTLEILVKILEAYDTFLEKGAFDGDDGWSMIPSPNDIDAVVVYLTKLGLDGDAAQLKKEYEPVQRHSMYHRLMLDMVGKSPKEQQACIEMYGVVFPLPSEDPEELDKDKHTLGLLSSGAAIQAACRIRSLIQHVMELDDSANISGNVLPPNSTGRKKGVSLKDAALILNMGDTQLANEIITRWRNSTSPMLPDPIGFDPEHSQRKLYEPVALLDFLEKIETKSICDEHQLKKGFASKTRYPREE